MIHMIQELFGQTLRDAGDYITSLPKAEPLPDLTHPPA
jgi:hypothetical protein